MKPITACLALGFLAAALPGVAQTSPALDGAAFRSITAPATTPMMLKGVHGGGGTFPLTPQQKALQDAKMDKINDLDQAGDLALRSRNFAAAEADYRELLQVTAAAPQMAPQTMLGPAPYYGLGEALAGQGKTAEAIAAYKVGVYCPLNFTPEAVAASQAIDNKPNLRGCCGGTDAVAWLKYALLLSQTGQNVEAFIVYSQARRWVNDPERSGITLFSAGSPQSPSEFQSAAHIALGLLTGGMLGDHERAMSEFAQALALAPDSAAANYYYGYGWQRLDLKSPMRAADAVQARAALTKAAVSDDDNVKRTALEALKRMP